MPSQRQTRNHFVVAFYFRTSERDMRHGQRRPHSRWTCAGGAASRSVTVVGRLMIWHRGWYHDLCDEGWKARCAGLTTSLLTLVGLWRGSSSLWAHPELMLSTGTRRSCKICPLQRRNSAWGIPSPGTQALVGEGTRRVTFSTEQASRCPWERAVPLPRE